MPARLQQHELVIRMCLASNRSVATCILLKLHSTRASKPVSQSVLQMTRVDYCCFFMKMLGSSLGSMVCSEPEACWWKEKAWNSTHGAGSCMRQRQRPECRHAALLGFAKLESQAQARLANWLIWRSIVGTQEVCAARYCLKLHHQTSMRLGRD